MIVNIYTIITLFTGFLSLFLGIFLLYATLKTLPGIGPVMPLETKGKFEQRGYLIFLLACVVLSIRMANWPWFYLMLQSFVPEVPGAMCMFGVTQVLPSLVTFLQIIKPVGFFVMGGWLLCYYVDKSTPTTPLARRNLLLLLPICGLLLADSAGDILYVFRMKPLISVSCCATFFDLPLRPSAMIPRAIFGPGYEKGLFILYYCTNAILIASLFINLSKKWASMSLLSKRVVLYIQGIMCIVNIPVVIITFIEVIAPRLMQLLFHHCIYCFLGNGTVPDAPVILGLYAIGTFATGWKGILHLLCKTAETKPVTDPLITRVNTLSAFCLMASVVMVTIHLIFI